MCGHAVFFPLLLLFAVVRAGLKCQDLEVGAAFCCCFFMCALCLGTRPFLDCSDLERRGGGKARSGALRRAAAGPRPARAPANDCESLRWRGAAAEARNCSVN